MWRVPNCRDSTLRGGAAISTPIPMAIFFPCSVSSARNGLLTHHPQYRPGAPHLGAGSGPYASRAPIRHQAWCRRLGRNGDGAARRHPRRVRPCLVVRHWRPWRELNPRNSLCRRALSHWAHGSSQVGARLTRSEPDGLNVGGAKVAGCGSAAARDCRHAVHESEYGPVALSKDPGDHGLWTGVTVSRGSYAGGRGRTLEARDAATAPPGAGKGGVFSRPYRALSIGIVSWSCW